MNRQHVTPLLLPDGGGPAVALTPIDYSAASGITEARIQSLVQSYPSCLPIAEIDPIFVDPIPICTELNTPAGPIDNFMVTPGGLPVLVECKLWRNPEGRREVVGQILDYAKELTRWSSSDLQREVARRLKRDGNPLLDLVRAAGHDIDEIGFNDALTLNLRRGRFLLLIVGDGIREGVEAIAEYLQVHAGLHFSLGLIELPIYASPDGQRLVVPRVLARTVTISREVVAVPEGYAVQDSSEAEHAVDEAPDDATLARVAFLQELISGPLALDPEQPVPRTTPRGYLSLYMPAPASSCWISISVTATRIGLWLTSNRGTPGEAAIRQIVGEWDIIAAQLGGTAKLRELGPGRFVIEDFLLLNPYSGARERSQAIDWLRDRMRDFVAVLRPRIRDAIEMLKD